MDLSTQSSLSLRKRLALASRVCVYVCVCAFFVGCEITGDVSFFTYVESDKTTQVQKQPPEDDKSANENKDCLFQDRIGDAKEIKLCSLRRLDSDELDYLNEQYENSKSLYIPYVSSRANVNIPDSTPLSLTIYLSTFDRINDKITFPNLGKDVTVYGWYFKNANRIYVIDKRVFSNAGRADLPHEIAHWLNHALNVHLDNKDKNEELAEGFENFYKSQF